MWETAEKSGILSANLMWYVRSIPAYKRSSLNMNTGLVPLKLLRVFHRLTLSHGRYLNSDGLAFEFRVMLSI